MDSRIVEAQHSYGMFIASRGSQRPLLKQIAQQCYDDILHSARLGDYECQCELWRILTEPQSIRDLAITPVSIVEACPIDWTEALLHRYPFSSDDLIKVIELQALRGGNPAVPTRILSSVATHTQDLFGLWWVSDHGTGPEQTSAFLSLAGLLTRNAADAASSVVQGTISQADAILVKEHANAWFLRASSFRVPPHIETLLKQASDVLSAALAKIEGNDLLASFEACMRPPVVELALWLRTVDHLIRKSRDWVEANGQRAEFSDVRRQLEALSSWAQQHRRQWGFSSMALIGVEPGLLIPATAGSCPYCATAFNAHTFCTQCGVQVGTNQTWRHVWSAISPNG